MAELGDPWMKEWTLRQVRWYLPAFSVIALVGSWLTQTRWAYDRDDGHYGPVLNNLTFLIVLLNIQCRYDPILKHPWRRRFWSAGQAGTLAALLLALLDAVLMWTGASARSPWGSAQVGPWHAADLLAPRGFAWLALMLVLGVVLDQIHRFQATALQESTLRREAQDAALRARLAPHFIFNTLATLKAQIDADPKEASATTDRLAALFRQVLALADRPTVPLREELDFVEAYLGIERARLGKRLRVKVEVPEEVEGVEIPPLSLQALVENAVKHGVAPREEGGEIVVAAGWNGPGSGKKLLVSVTSPASPVGSTPAASTGTGLATLRGRLARPADLTTITSGGRFKAEFAWKGGAAA